MGASCRGVEVVLTAVAAEALIEVAAEASINITVEVVLLDYEDKHAEEFG